MWGCGTEGVDVWGRARWKRVVEHGRAATAWREERRENVERRRGRDRGYVDTGGEDTVVAMLGCWVSGMVLGVAARSRDGACVRRQRVKRGDAREWRWPYRG